MSQIGADHYSPPPAKQTPSSSSPSLSSTSAPEQSAINTEQKVSESSEKEKRTSSVVRDVLTFASSVGRLFSGGHGSPAQVKASSNERHDTDEVPVPLTAHNNSKNTVTEKSNEKQHDDRSNLESKHEHVINSLPVSNSDTEPNTHSNMPHPPLLNFPNKSAVLTAFTATPKSISAPSVSCMDLAMASTPLTPAVIPGIAMAAAGTFSVMEREDSRSDATTDRAKRRTKSSPTSEDATSTTDEDTSKRPSEKSSVTTTETKETNNSNINSNNSSSNASANQSEQRHKHKRNKQEKPMCLKSPRAVLRALVPADAAQSRRMNLLLLHESPRWSDLTDAAWNGCSHTNRAHIWRLLVGYEPLRFSDREAALRAKRTEYRHFIRALYAPMGRVRFDSVSPACTAEVENIDVYNVDAEHDLLSDLDIVTNQGGVDEEDDDEECKYAHSIPAAAAVITGKMGEYKQLVKSGVSHARANIGTQNNSDGSSAESQAEEVPLLNESTIKTIIRKEEVDSDEVNGGSVDVRNEMDQAEDVSLKRHVIEYSSFSAKTLRQIEMDLPRTHPNIPVFHIPQVRNSMRRILYIYGMLNPNNNYVQGMNEILSAVIIVFLVECEITKERRQQQSPWMSRSSTQYSNRPLPTHSKDASTWSGRPPSSPLLSAGYSFVPSASPSASTSSSSSSPRSPNSWSIESFLQRTDLGDVLTGQELVDAEADAYWTFSSIIALIDDNFVPDQPGIMRRVARLEEIVSKVDPALSEHLANNGNDFLQFAFRWMNCLLMRELPFGLVIKLWDSLLAHPNGISDFHIYFCAALITRFTDHLIEMDFEQCMLFLQHLPTSCWTDDDIDELLSQAYMWERSLALECTAQKQ